MARIAALQAKNRALTERVVKLEEELVLARLHRFAPKSERHVDRLFDEAEQVADDDASAEDGEVVPLPDTGLPSTERPQVKKRGRKPLPEHLARERVEYDIADDQKACPCCRHQMHRMGEAVTEQLHIEVKAKILQNVRFKYAAIATAPASTRLSFSRQCPRSPCRAASPRPRHWPSRSSINMSMARRSTGWPRPSSVPVFPSAAALWGIG